MVTQTVGFYVDGDGNQIWICPQCKKPDDGSPMIGCDECDDWYHWVCEFKLEVVMYEMRKNQNFHFDLQIHPTLINSTYLHCQMTGFIPIRVQNFQNVE